MYYVYFLLLNNENIYTGSTNNLKRRIVEHKNKKPLKLIAYEAYLIESDALRREKFFKTTEGKRLLRLQLKDCFQKYKVRPIIR
ncbi:GIY-YIG nuclease family protein [Candidatus Aerophobetes bacterium]|uniref:GIY-YIG nuclease family protein n=1 Tax=Aerophobetes bacterium TaxID=2030807 RepID=A0A662D5W3_UNCAE|nr:MAG: GIY-YIG nuclease family protein [Candidatus Aerophobetes bacterium]